MISMPTFHLLLIEDNPDDVELTREALRGSAVPVECHVARNGREALSFLGGEGAYRNRPWPHLILLDLNLPGQDGRDLLRVLKAHEVYCPIPVIILSTSAAREDVLRAYENHVNCYLKKPVDFEQYEKVIRCIEEFWFHLAELPPGESP